MRLTLHLVRVSNINLDLTVDTFLEKRKARRLQDRIRKNYSKVISRDYDYLNVNIESIQISVSKEELLRRIGEQGAR